MSGLEQGGKHLRMTEVQKQTKRSLELTLVSKWERSEGKLGRNQHDSRLIVESESCFFQQCPFSGKLHNHSESAFYRDDKSMVEIYAHSD